jgi:hypothetical protein
MWGNQHDEGFAIEFLDRRLGAFGFRHRYYSAELGSSVSRIRLQNKPTFTWSRFDPMGFLF